MQCSDCGSTTRPTYCAPVYGNDGATAYRQEMHQSVCRCRVFLCATCHRARKKARKAKGRERTVSKYGGLTAEQYEAIKAAQGGTCAVYGCRANGKTKALAVEHDHKCQESHGGEIRLCCIRGLMCSVHNEWIGRAGDQASVFLSIAAYLTGAGRARVRWALDV